MHTTKRGGQCNSSHLLIVNKLRSACVNKWVDWTAVLRESVLCLPTGGHCLSINPPPPPPPPPPRLRGRARGPPRSLRQL